MNEILHANIFFFIASIASIFFCILVSVALWQVIKILQLVRAILERIEAGSEVLASELAHIRMFFAEGGLLTKFLNLFGLFGGSTKPRRPKKVKAEQDI